jgi:hypothetical protein
MEYAEFRTGAYSLTAEEKRTAWLRIRLFMHLRSLEPRSFGSPSSGIGAGRVRKQAWGTLPAHVVSLAALGSMQVTGHFNITTK